ncbi:MAG: sugar phosphate isomerase/epimerase family protein [Roseiflexaceae bacterium]
MQQPEFILSAFGDEIADDLAEQLDLLEAEGVRHLEVRGAWGQNVLDLDDAQLARAAGMLRERGFGVSAIGSPVGKSSIEQPRAYELERLRRAIAAAEAFGTPRIRVFSFYVPAGRAAEHRDEVLARMAALAEAAAHAGMTLLHENEREIYGDTAERCRDILEVVGSPALRMAFDPANFVQVGVRPMDEAWPLLADYTTHIHIKDALFEGGAVRPAGAGDGAIPELLRTLASRGYRGFLTLEPHLHIAGRAGGFSGPDGMRTAIHALRGLLDALSG